MTVRPLPLAALVLPAVALCLTACTSSPGGHAAGSTTGATSPGDGVPVVVAVRAVCRLIADNPDSAVAHIRGTDGAPSIVVGGTDYWFFGDTVRDGAGGRQDVIPAAVATSSDFDGSDCVRLEFKKAAGTAEPLFPRLDETTSWPDGIIPLGDGSLAFYIVRAYRTSPFAWHVGGVGLGRVAAGTTDGVRTVETIWDEQSGFGSRIAGVRSPVRLGGDVIVYIRTDAGGNYVAKAPVDGIERADAYRYWDGNGWSARPEDAARMWESVETGFPADNGVSVSFDARSGKWLAISNGELARVTARVGDEPWGPWSAPATWFDCAPLVEDAYPFCYSAEPHRELSGDPNTLYVTISSQRPYDVTLLELRLGVAIHEWRAAGGELRYGAAASGGVYADEGVAFYAGAGPAPGLSPVFLRDGAYKFDGRGYGPPAFYASASPATGAIRTTAVYRWRRDGQEALAAGARDGWQRGEVAFYVPCAGARGVSCDG